MTKEEKQRRKRLFEERKNSLYGRKIHSSSFKKNETKMKKNPKENGKKSNIRNNYYKISYDDTSYHHPRQLGQIINNMRVRYENNNPFSYDFENSLSGLRELLVDNDDEE